MSETFRIGKNTYNIKNSSHDLSESKKIRKLAKELEIARATGKYGHQAQNIASKIPKHAYDIVEEYIKKHGRKLYGGSALNMLLPQKHKIYKRDTLPDYDFFSPDPWNDAIKISDLLYKAGYKYTEAKSGIHKGTFKVFADFLPIADITYLPEDLYDKVPTIKKQKFKVVSPAYIQMTLYNIISKPIESPIRWPKVAFRQKLLEQWAPPKYRKQQCSKDFIGVDNQPAIDPELEKALQIVYKESRKSKLIHGGALAYNKYIEIGGGNLRLPVYYYELFAEDAGAHAEYLETAISKVTTQTLIADVSYLPHKDMNNVTFILFMEIDEQKVPIFSITELTRCIPVKYLGGRHFCSIDYLFYELYHQMFNSDTTLHSFDVSCLIRYLHYIQNKYYKKLGISELDKSPLQRFVTTCRGPFVDVIREEFYSRWIDRAELQTQITNIVPKGDTVKLIGVDGRKIRVYPDNSFTSTECSGLQKDNCNYPCNWVDDLGMCGNIPYTGYQPGQQTLKVSGKKIINLKTKTNLNKE